jgi:hypothetical protein
LFDLNVPKPGDIRRQIGKFKETQHKGCQFRVGMTRVDWHEKDSELIIKPRYERVSPEGQVGSVDKHWSRKGWVGLVESY